MMAGDNFRELAAQKEKEWRQVQELRNQSVEIALKEKEREYNELRGKFQKLKEDFKYNLKLLGERDAELERYDSAFSETKSLLATKEADISDLKIRIDSLQETIRRDSQAREESQLHYQQRIREKQKEVDQYRSAKDSEIEKERQELETFKRNLDRQVRELEDELGIQRQELNSGYEDAMRKRDHEHRTKMDEMSSQLLAHELKSKLLSKELELLTDSQSKTTQEFEQVEGDHRELEKRLKQREWELEDTKAVKNARIKELESQQQHSEKHIKQIHEDFKRKHAEADRNVREKDEKISRLKEAHQEKENELLAQIRDANSMVEDLQVKVRQVEWNKEDLEKDKNALIEQLNEQLLDTNSRWERQMSDTSRANVARDLEVEALRANEGKLQADIAQRKDDVERYKRELNTAIEREAALERAKAQLDLDWQKRYEELERMQYERSEDLVKNLTKAKEEAVAEAKETNRELRQREDLVKILTKERNEAMVTLKQHGLVMDKNMDLSSFKEMPKSAADQITNLQTQNTNLRAVIQQMRHQMEQLGQTVFPSTDKSDSVAGDYVRDLEQELQDMKFKYRELKDATTDRNKFTEVEEKAVKAAGDNVLVRSHIDTLNNTVGSLRAEKVELMAQLRKCQARIQSLETMVDQLSKEPRKKQVEIEQLRYELGAQSRRAQAEEASMKQRITDLEMQVVETRKEADEYFKATIERNMESTQLSQKISAMKMDQAENRPSINFGAQELLIQQLQDEIKHLHQLKRGVELQPTEAWDSTSRTSNLTELQLKEKLRMAAKHIKQLAKEKQQLIDLGNRLRAELNKHGITFPAPPRPSFAPVTVEEKKPTVLSQKIQSKLGQLEKLQYELTKQQLVRQTGGHGGVPRLPVESEPSDSGDELQAIPQARNTAHSGLQPKLSPVPEDSTTRPKTAESDTFQARPITANSEPVLRQSAGDQSAIMMSMSSFGGESIQELWHLLDDERYSSPTPRPHTADQQYHLEETTDDRPKTADSGRSFTVKGKSTSVHSVKTGSKKPTQRGTGKFVSSKYNTPSRPKIRNYNQMDDRK